MDRNERVDKLVKFLDSLPEETYVSPGDVSGYIKGFFGENDAPEDEIETFDTSNI